MHGGWSVHLVQSGLFSLPTSSFSLQHGRSATSHLQHRHLYLSISSSTPGMKGSLAPPPPPPPPPGMKGSLSPPPSPPPGMKGSPPLHRVDELVNEPLGDIWLADDALLVVLSYGAAQLVIVHGRTILPQAPQPGHVGRVLDLEDAWMRKEKGRENTGTYGTSSREEITALPLPLPCC